MNWVLVFIGGGVGSLLRYGLSFMLPGVELARGHFPWSTLAANLSACLLLGVVATLLAREALSKEAALLLLTGLCGGFSTFSTFTAELLTLTQSGHNTLALLYLLTSLLGGLGSIWLAMALLR